MVLCVCGVVCVWCCVCVVLCVCGVVCVWCCVCVVLCVCGVVCVVLCVCGVVWCCVVLCVCGVAECKMTFLPAGARANLWVLLDLHETHATVTGYGEPVVVTKARDLYTGSRACLQHGGSRVHKYSYVVHENFDLLVVSRSSAVNPVPPCAGQQ